MLRRAVVAAIVLSLLLTVFAGVTMRWALAGAFVMPLDFARVRHAHAHLAYYGLLVPVAWGAWHARGLSLPSPVTGGVYGVAVLLSIVGFLRAGYAPEAIVGSTVVGAVWLASGWRTRARLRDLQDPLGGMLPGLVLCLACVPFVARFTRAAPALGQAWVATFLAALLFLVVVPTALGLLEVRRPWPALVGAGTLGSLALGVWPHPVGYLGLAVYGLLVLPVRWTEHPLHLRATWTALGLGVLAMAAGLLPNTRPVVIGAIHFTALSVALPSFASLTEVPRDGWGWWVHHGAVGLLCAPIVWQAFGGGAWTWTAAAVGGSVVGLEVLGLLAWQGLGQRSSA